LALTVNDSVLKDSPELEDVLQPIADKLTTEELQKLNASGGRGRAARRGRSPRSGWRTTASSADEPSSDRLGSRALSGVRDV
ncbi:MAG: hypothetical protein WKF73_08660, partial [Nocardioidaceae bacterium]